MLTMGQPLPEQIILLKTVCSDVIDERVTRALHESQETLSQVLLFASNLKRKDFTGKLKELITTKTFTYPFLLKKKLSPCLLIIEPIGQTEQCYTCVLPTELETALSNKQFFVEKDIYLFAQLSICVARGPPAVIFFSVTPSTKSKIL